MIIIPGWEQIISKTEPLNAADAIKIASNWIKRADLIFRAAFIGGSVSYADPASSYDPASDIDCYLVIDGEPPDGKIGKITVDGTLLDVSWLPWSQLQSAESHSVLASLLHFGTIVVDRDNTLSELKTIIDETFATPATIARRLDDMRARISVIASDPRQLPAPEMVMNWLFPATLATHIPLIASCAPLTVRKRFVAAKNVMAADDYEQLLGLFGFNTVTPEQAQMWLDDTAALFDHAAPFAAESSRFWSSDIRADARAIAIGGSQQLIDTDLHREALYWIIATRTRCLTVMNDAEADTSSDIPAFTQMTSALGIASAEQRAFRSQSILQWINSYEHPH